MRATAHEERVGLPGDDRLAAVVVLDRGFSLPAGPGLVWPWLVQVGKGRAGWYLPRSVERFVPRSRRAVRHVEPRLQSLEVGQVIDDWGGSRATLTVLDLAPGRLLLLGTRRGRVSMTWAVTLTATGAGSATRVHSRVRLAGVRRVRLAERGGGLLDLLSIAGLAAGLRERVGEQPGGPAGRA